MGMPEIKLGLLPGAGDTWRLTRLCRAAAALQMMAGGQPVGAEEALALGLVHRLADGELLTAAKIFAREVAARRPLPRSSTMPAAQAEAEAKAVLAAFEQDGRKGATAEIAACVRRVYEVPFAQALLAERAAFERCRASPESQTLLHLFFAERKARQIPGLSDEARPRAVRRVGIVGAGTMGGGIAMNFANAGIPVRLVDVSAEALQRGLDRVFELYEGARAKGRLSDADVATRRGLMTGHAGLEALSSGTRER